MMTKSEQLQFCERLDTLRKIVSDVNLLANKSSLVQQTEWGGAGLIITTDPDRNRWESDTFVVVEDIKPVLWLMDELRELYDELGSDISKYTYYPHIGKSISREISNGHTDTISILNTMIEAVINLVLTKS
ncbi:hypothetical protein [Fundidesulfovibrio agrisoli]|uniref:hypothetical protein n=1 Tax=Fundidesulfovibrio agrisoli TaxID=2922717 RepID=UPI001FAD576A|nr:hypothetical protein [Fundidesulfovibrio agrisoli]